MRQQRTVPCHISRDYLAHRNSPLQDEERAKAIDFAGYLSVDKIPAACVPYETKRGSSYAKPQCKKNI